MMLYFFIVLISFFVSSNEVTFERGFWGLDRRALHSNEDLRAYLNKKLHDLVGNTNMNFSDAELVTFDFELKNGNVQFIFEKYSSAIAHLKVITDDDDGIVIEKEDIQMLKQEYSELLSKVKTEEDEKHLALLGYLSTARPGYVIKPRDGPLLLKLENDDEEKEQALLEEYNHRRRVLEEYHHPARRILQKKKKTKKPTTSPTIKTSQPTLKPTRKPSLKPTSRSPTRRPTTRAPTFRCGDYFLSNWKTDPHPNPLCPTYTSKKVVNNDVYVSCLCPWAGTTPREALFDGRRPSDGAWKSISWKLKYGRATANCLGRCGPGCPFFYSTSKTYSAFQDW